MPLEIYCHIAGDQNILLTTIFKLFIIINNLYYECVSKNI